VTTLQTEPIATAKSLPVSYDKRMMVAAGRASGELGQRIAERLGMELTDAGLKTFPDGEVYCRYADSIRGADIFIVQSICGNEREGISANDALMELLIMIEAAVGASAHRVIAVTPWYGYSRQDKKSAPREPITARLVAKMLETAGVDRVVTMDLHAGQVQGFFSKPVDHMTAMPILTQHVKDQLGDEENLVVIAPDAGRVKLTRNFARKVGTTYALLEKERPAQGVAEIGTVIGDVRGKVAVIVDDIIGTGGTLAAAAQTVIERGASKVYAVATHILTDSVRRIFTDDSVSEIFSGENHCSRGREAHRACARSIFSWNRVPALPPRIAAPRVTARTTSSPTIAPMVAVVPATGNWGRPNCWARLNCEPTTVPAMASRMATTSAMTQTPSPCLTPAKRPIRPAT
jgi:ribose-phosphate pyrophosphokinase